LPVIALADSDSPLENVDIAIPCNNRARHSLAVVYWLLAREVLRMRGEISRAEPWKVMVDLFIYREPEDLEKDKVASVNAAQAQLAQGAQASGGAQSGQAAAASYDGGNQYGDVNYVQSDVRDWAAEQEEAQGAQGSESWGAPPAVDGGAPW